MTQTDGKQATSGSTADDSRWSLTREGCSILVARDVRASPAVAMEAFRDTRTWPEWSPSIDAVESTDRYVRTGTRGRVRVAGVPLPFHVTAVSGRRWSWRVAGIPATDHRIRAYAGDSDRCQVGIEMPALAVGYVPVCKRALDRFAALVERD